jgi:hypothetical protein
VALPRRCPERGCACSLELARRGGLAPLAPPSRGLPRGECPPVDSAALGFAAPLLDLRCVSTGVREVPTTGVRHMRKHTRATLLTLTPTLPSRPDPCGPTCRPDCLSWGCPKIAPPSYRTGESDARGPCLHVPLRGGTASSSRVPPAWFRTTSTVFSSPTVQVCFALLPIMGFAVFLPVAKRASSQRLPALRSLPPADSDGSGTSPSPWARVTARPLLIAPSPRALPPHPCPPAP